MTSQLFDNDDVLHTCSKFKLKQRFSDMIHEFFEYLHEKLRQIEAKKMEQLQAFFQSTSCEDLSRKAEFLQKRQTQMHDYVKNLKDNYFANKKFSKILEQSTEIKDQMEAINFHQQEVSQLLKDYEKHKNINLVCKSEGVLETLEKIVKDSIKVPSVNDISERKDTLHFFVYNSH